MTYNPDVHILVQSRQPNITIFDLTTGEECLQASLQQRGGESIYTIAPLEGWPLEQSVGKLLLEASLEHAQNVGADKIVASIASREYLDAAREVFGEKHVSALLIGSYVHDVRQGNAEDVRTKAALLMKLS